MAQTVRRRRHSRQRGDGGRLHGQWAQGRATGLEDGGDEVGRPLLRVSIDGRMRTDEVCDAPLGVGLVVLDQM